MERTRRYILLYLVGAAVILLGVACGSSLPGSSSFAQPQPTTAIAAFSISATDTAIISTTMPSSATPAAEENVLSEYQNALLERARQQGSVRIIVVLAVPWQPEGDLTDEAAAETQRQVIADAQAAFLSRLSLLNVSEITRFQFIPSIAMVVDPTALEAIFADAGVQSVQEDGVASPSNDAPAAPSFSAPN